MSAIGTKRTSACALHMSAFDPKRTFRLSLSLKADCSRTTTNQIFSVHLSKIKIGVGIGKSERYAVSGESLCRPLRYPHEAGRARSQQSPQ